MLFHAVFKQDKGYIYKSPEITRDELDEIREYFDYQHKNEFIGYTYIRLKSQRYTIIKSFSQDDKNIFHAIILDMNLKPFEYIHQNIFISSTEDISNLKTTLDDTVLIKEPLDFLNGRLDKSIRDIVYLLIKENTKINIIDKEENILNWLNAIFYCFPIEVSKNITFTTNPYFRGDVRVFLTHEAIQNGVYIFDFKRGLKPSLVLNGSYIKFIDIGVFSSKQIYRTYMNFIGYFNYNELNSKLNDSYNLFVLLNAPNALKDYNQIKSAVRFMIDYIKPEERQALIENTINSLDYLTDKITIDIAKDFYEFIFKDIELKKGVFDRAVNIFYRSFFNMVKNEYKLDKLMELYNDILEQNKNKPYFYTYVLDKTWFKYLQDFVGTKEAYIINLYVVVLCASYSGFSMSQLKKIDGFDKAFVEGINDDIIEHILNSIDDREFYLSFCIEAYLIYKSNILFDGIYEKYKEADYDFKRHICRKILDLKQCELVYKLYLEELNNQDDLEKYFNEYKQNILEYFMEYTNEYLGKIVSEYLKSLDRQKRFNEAKKLLIEYVINTSHICNKEAAEKIIETFELGITLENYNENKDLIEQVKYIKNKNEIKTNINMSFLEVIYILDDFKEGNFDELIEEIKYIMRQYEIQNTVKHRAIILYKVVRHLTYFEYHKSIYEMFYEEEDVLAYFDFIKLNKNLSNYKDIFCSFISFYLYYIEPKFRLIKRDDINTKVEEEIVNEITTFKKSELKYFDDEINRTFKNLNLSIPVKWSTIFKNASERMTFKYKLKSIFKGK